jgi:TonB family protein
MRKIFYLYVFTTFFSVTGANAQLDTVKTYMKLSDDMWTRDNHGYVVKNRDSADFVRLIISPTNSTGKTLYSVKDLYLNGRIKLISMSASRFVYPDFDGTCIEYYLNGNIKTISNYKNGQKEGEQIVYYPNGLAYYSVSHHQNKVKLINCNDSIGKALAVNGNGKWVKYSDDFKTVMESGPVLDSLEQGEWKGHFNDTLNYICNYTNGVITSGTSYDSGGNVFTFTEKKILPEFYGGLNGFTRFLRRKIKYPRYAWQNGIQGRVIVTFIVEKNGTLADIKISRGTEPSLDAEAMRIMQESPKWKPAYLYGVPVRVQFSVPIIFLANIKNNQD